MNTAPVFRRRLANALRHVRVARLIALLAFSLAAGLAADWFRAEHRLLFPRPLPAFTTLPAR